MACLSGYKPKSQKHLGAFDDEQAAGCKATGLLCKDQKSFVMFPELTS
jgi:hypothetical protein